MMRTFARRCERRDARFQDSRAFSLLEVIVATGILAASTVLLLSLFGTGRQHAEKAETRVAAQMLCQTKLDELLADPLQLRSVDDEPIAGFPQWTYSVDFAPTKIQGLARLRVAVRKVRPLGRSQPDQDIDTRNAFELVRWTRDGSTVRPATTTDKLPSLTAP